MTSDLLMIGYTLGVKNISVVVITNSGGNTEVENLVKDKLKKVGFKPDRAQFVEVNLETGDGLISSKLGGLTMLDLLK